MLHSLQVLDKYGIHSRSGSNFNVLSLEFGEFAIPGRQVSLSGKVLKAVECCAYPVHIVHAVEQKVICSRWRVITVCLSRYKTFPGGGTTEPTIASQMN